MLECKQVKSNIPHKYGSFLVTYLLFLLITMIDNSMKSYRKQNSYCIIMCKILDNKE